MSASNEVPDQEPVTSLEEINLEEVTTLTSSTDTAYCVPIVFERLDSSMLSATTGRLILPQKNELITFDRFCESLFDKMRSESRMSKRPVSARSKIERLERLIFGPPALKPELKPCRDQLVEIAATSFDNSDPIQQTMLRTIYLRLTNSSVYHRYGPHWESIGFQGKLY